MKQACVCPPADMNRVRLFLNGLGRFFLESYFREVDAGEGLDCRWHLADEARYLATCHIATAQQHDLLRPGKWCSNFCCDLRYENRHDR